MASSPSTLSPLPPTSPNHPPRCSPSPEERTAARLLTIDRPEVFLVGYMTADSSGLRKFLKTIGAGAFESDARSGNELLAENGGRLCYLSFASPRPGGVKEYFNRIRGEGHGSVLEHGVFSFVLCGVSRSLTHELVRHRAGASYSQLSQRFVDESQGEYVIPRIIAADPELSAVWHDAVRHAHAAYVALADRLTAKLALSNPTDTATARRKKCRQAARSVLPNATETKIQITMNARALRHFIEKRAAVDADPEIRDVAFAMYLEAAAHSPNLFADYEVHGLPDGSNYVLTTTPKV